MTDERSERLRKRRKQSIEPIERRTPSDDGPGSDRTGETDDPGDRRGTRDRDEQASGDARASANVGGNGDATDAEDAHDSQASGDGGMSIKEEQIGTYMYLPESQTAELRRLYNVLKAEYEFEYDEEFEKNRHFYPLVVRYGLERLDGMEASEIRDCLEEIP